MTRIKRFLADLLGNQYLLEIMKPHLQLKIVKKVVKNGWFERPF